MNPALIVAEKLGYVPHRSSEDIGETTAEHDAARRRASRPPRVSLPRRLARAVLSYRRATLFSTQLAGGFATVERDGFTCHWLSDPSDPLVDLADEPDLVRAALARGDGVSVAMRGGVFASRLTVSLRSFREPFMGVRIHLRTGHEAWLGEMHTQPEFRRYGLARYLSSATMNNLGVMGIHTLYASVEDWNEASRRLTQRLGFSPSAEFRFLRIFRRWGVAVPGSAHPDVPPLSAPPSRAGEGALSGSTLRP